MKVVISISAEKETITALEVMAKEENRNISNMIEHLILEEIQRKQKKRREDYQR